MQPEANVSRSQSLTSKFHVDEILNSPNGVKKDQSLKVSQVSLSQVGLPQGVVRTPEGDGEVLQYFCDRIIVRLGERVENDRSWPCGRVDFSVCVVAPPGERSVGAGRWEAMFRGASDAEGRRRQPGRGARGESRDER